MSEPVAKKRLSVDFDDYDTHSRRSMQENDPLAELARLVGETPDPYGDVFAREASLHDQFDGHGDARRQDFLRDERRAPGFGAEPVSPRLSGDFAAIEAGLRGALGSPSQPIHAVSEPVFDAPAQDGHDFAAPGAEDWAQQQVPAPDRAAVWARRPVAVIAATICLGVVGIGAAFALKGHATSPSEVKTIMADAGPTKIAPPADGQQDQASLDPAVLDKTSQPAPTQLVSREEQPVDLGQAVQENAAAHARETDASSVPVPPSPDQAAGQPGSSFGLSGMPEPKKVKVVSVRPDGTILQNDSPPAAAMPVVHAPVPPTAEQAAPVAKASTPKSTSRVPTTSKSTAALDDTDTTATPKPAPAKAAKKAKLAKVATADSGSSDAATDLTSKSAALSAGHGGFAVQLAAPGTEAEAKSASTRLSKKFAGALSGRHLAFHKADSNGKSVYRVRVSSLSKEDATSLCEKLKADGGSCFVAKSN